MARLIVDHGRPPKVALELRRQTQLSSPSSAASSASANLTFQEWNKRVAGAVRPS